MQIFVDGGGGNGGLATGFSVFFRSGVRDGEPDVIQDCQLGPPFVGVLLQDLATQLRCERLRHFLRVPFNGKVQVADLRASQHIAHCSSRQPNPHPGVRGDALHFGNNAVLAGIQVAFENKHEIAHNWIVLMFQALGWCSSSVLRRRDLTTCV